MKDEVKEKIAELVNNLNLGTAKALLGALFIGMLDRIEELEKGSGGGSTGITVDGITDASTVGKSVLKAADGAAARTAIGAGTSSLVIGTSAAQAAAGNHTHPVATTTVNGLMLAADKAKIDLIAASATKNDTDANLKNRANHTGTQAISTITGLAADLAAKASGADLTALAARVTALETP